MIDYIALEKYGRELSVLFVEDDESISKEMNFLLGDIFTKVDSGFDGIEGLSKYKEHYNLNEKYYDLVITDIRMPNMNGIELIKNIYSINPSQKVIVLSAHNESEYLMELVNIGIAQFILKPIDYNNFLDVIYKVSKMIYENKLLNSTNEKKEISPFVNITENIIWNKELKQLFLDDNMFKLTKKELLLVDLLLQVPEKTYTNEEIMFTLWNDDYDVVPDIANLKNLISRLRKKLPNLNIENIYGFGYRLNIKS